MTQRPGRRARGRARGGARRRSSAPRALVDDGDVARLPRRHRPSVPDDVDTARAARDARRRSRSAMTELPAGLHARTRRSRACSSSARRWARGERPLDWGMAELLAYGSLLVPGHVNVRLSGQDSARGTFSHRHAVITDIKTGREHLALGQLHPEQGQCRIYDSPLSEAGVHGLRVRLLARLPRRARDVGGAVRRLRERRAGDHRPVHHVVGGQVEAPLRPRAAPAARLRRAGAGALERAPRALPAARAPRTTSRSRSRRRRRRCSTCCAAGAAAAAQAADRDDAEEPAAPAGGDVAARRARRPASSSACIATTPRRTRRRSRACCCAPARSTTSSSRSARSASDADVAIVRIEQLYPWWPQLRRAAIAAPFPQLDGGASGCRTSRATWAR